MQPMRAKQKVLINHVSLTTPEARLTQHCTKRDKARREGQPFTHQRIDSFCPNYTETNYLLIEKCTCLVY